MASNPKNRSDLKSYFVKNAIPTESNFADLIDAALNQADDGVFKLPDDPLSIVADGGPDSQKKALHLYEARTPDAKPAWVLALNPRSVASDPASARPGLGIGDSAGASRLFIDKATGNVGIGTINASHKLHVVADSAVGLFESTSNQAFLRFASSEGFNNRVEICNRPGGRLALWTAGAGDVFNITRGGNVGIGEINPGFKLMVETTENHVQLNRAPNANGGKVLFLELKQQDGSPAAVPEVFPSIRFHHGNRFWHRIEARGDGFHFKDGNLANDGYRKVATGALTVLADSNPINFTTAWSSTPDGATNVAEISNDTNKFQTLMLIGNRSAGLTEPGKGRRVSVWDILEVNGDLKVSRDAEVSGVMKATAGVRVDGNLQTHIDADGAFYRYKGQVYLTIDDNLYIRDHTRSNLIHLDTANNQINMGRGMLLFNAGSVQRGTVVGAVGFLGYGVQHGELAFRAGFGFEMVDRSSNGPDIGYNRDQYPYADLRVRALAQGSSRTFKENIVPMAAREALEALEALEPVHFRYRNDPDGKAHVGFIAEDVPEMVADAHRMHLNALEIVAVLTKVVKEQQAMIEALASGQVLPGSRPCPANP